MTQQQELQVVLRTVAQTAGASQVSNALRGVQRQAAEASRSTSLFGREGSAEMVRFATSLVGVNLGLSLAAGTADKFREVLGESINVTREHERIVRATAAAYGTSAVQFQRFAASLEAQTGFTSDAILEAALSARTLSTNYGLTTEQTQKLITVSADLARVRGIGVAEAFERVQSAIRGEAEASEFLGLTLNATFLQQHAANGAYRETFTTLTDSQKAQVVYNELLRQTATFSGLASQHTNNLDAAFDKAAVSGRKLQLTIGEMVKPTTLAGLGALALVFDALAHAMKAASEVPAFLGGAVGARAAQDHFTEAKAAQEAAVAERELRRVRALNENLPPVGDPLARFRQAALERTRVDQQNRRLLEINELPTRDRTAELARVAFLDQLEAGTRELAAAQQQQNDLQRQAIALSAQEAEIRLRQLPAERAMAELQRQSSQQQITARLGALPATEAFEDLQFAQRRAQLVVSDRNLTPEQRRDARRELRSLSRSAPDVELRALDASRRVTEAQRPGTRIDLQAQLLQLANAGQIEGIKAQQETNQLLQSINTAVEQTAQQQVADIVAQAIKDGLAEQKPIHVTLNVTLPDGSTQVIDQLIEANGQAQTPPTIQVSGVRR